MEANCTCDVHGCTEDVNIWCPRCEQSGLCIDHGDDEPFQCGCFGLPQPGLGLPHEEVELSKLLECDGSEEPKLPKVPESTWSLADVKSTNKKQDVGPRKGSIYELCIKYFGNDKEFKRILTKKWNGLKLSKEEKSYWKEKVAIWTDFTTNQKRKTSPHRPLFSRMKNEVSVLKW